jgi:hypothetical protein
MVYVVQSSWACFGLYPSSCTMWKTKKSHNVSETGSVSVLRWMGQDKPTQLGPLERASLNHWTFYKGKYRVHTGYTDRLERILTMVYVVQSYWACFGHYPSSCSMWKTKNPTMFRRLDLSPSSGGWSRINLLSWARQKELVSITGPFLRVNTGSSTYKTMDKVQNKPNSSVQLL